MSVVFDRPYAFVPPHHGNAWPSFIQTFRIVDRYLRKKEGVVSYECRNFDRLQASLNRGDGIVLAPNHSRYADPLVMGWPARKVGTHVFAMASWHLFNTGWFDAFAIRKMGAFSIYREGADRQSLETAISILASAERPLILFPEGTTSRSNDVLIPLLDGVTFIARSAARRRAKESKGRVVIHPIGIKYLCQSDITSWARQQLEELESRLGWPVADDESILSRCIRLCDAWLALQEIRYQGHVGQGALAQRRDALAEHLLATTEQRLELEPKDRDPLTRIRAIRSQVAARFYSDSAIESDRTRLQHDAFVADLAQVLVTYPANYLHPDEVTDTRIVETIQRLQEAVIGKPNVSVPLKVVIDCDEAIEVPSQKAPRGQPDPLLETLRGRLESMVRSLAKEARPWVS